MLRAALFATLLLVPALAALPTASAESCEDQTPVYRITCEAGNVIDHQREQCRDTLPERWNNYCHFIIRNPFS